MKDSQFYYLLAIGELNLAFSSDGKWATWWVIMACFSTVLVFTSKYTERYEQKENK